MELREPTERVSPRARLMWATSTGLQAVVVLTAVTLGLALWLGFAWWWLVVDVLLLVGYAGGVPLWRWRVHRWEVTDTAVYTQIGWWARERRIAPMSRIQTVDLALGPLEQLFRLASVTVTTASAAGALRIEGLDRRVAERLVDELTRQADSVAGDAT